MEVKAQRTQNKNVISAGQNKENTAVYKKLKKISKLLLSGTARSYKIEQNILNNSRKIEATTTDRKYTQAIAGMADVKQAG